MEERENIMVAFGESTTAAELERAKRMLANASKKQDATPAATVNAALTAEISEPALDIDELISQARARLALAPVKPVAENKQEAPQPDVVNSLLAEADQLKRIEDKAKKDRDKITGVLAELTGQAEELTVHGATVFTVKTVESRVLNTDFIKSKHPDIDGNEDYWKTTSSVRRNYK